MHTVSRTIGPNAEVQRKRSLSGAGAEFINQALHLIAANGARDTRAGWSFYRAALRIGRDIDKGLITAADLCGWGEAVAFTAGR